MRSLLDCFSDKFDRSFPLKIVKKMLLRKQKKLAQERYEIGKCSCYGGGTGEKSRRIETAFSLSEYKDSSPADLTLKRHWGATLFYALFFYIEPRLRLAQAALLLRLRWSAHFLQYFARLLPGTNGAQHEAHSFTCLWLFRISAHSSLSLGNTAFRNHLQFSE